jgi:hypothetical protein
VSERHDMRSAEAEWVHGGGAHGGPRAREIFSTPQWVLICGLVMLVVIGWAYMFPRAMDFLFGDQKRVEISHGIMRCQPEATYRRGTDSFVGQNPMVQELGSDLRAGS